MKEYISGILSTAFWILMGILAANEHPIGILAFVGLLVFVTLSRPYDGKWYRRW